MGKYVSLFLVLLIACLLTYFVLNQWKNEKFENSQLSLRTEPPSDKNPQVNPPINTSSSPYDPSEEDNLYLSNTEKNFIPGNTLPSDCYPRDQLSPQDLLPKDANSTWSQVVPQGQGSLMNKNFLNAGYHLGINTVGQTLRNANRQLRSEPSNPQVKVSPWMQSTIEPDTNRRPLEISCTPETSGQYCVDYNS